MSKTTLTIEPTICGFIDFANPVHERYNELAKNELFVVGMEDLVEVYLAAFPPGTNPIYRERTEHDCSTCKQFLRNLGKVVGLSETGEVLTVWDGFESLPYPYNVVAEKVRETVRNASIVGVFRSKEGSYGCSHSYDAEGNRYNHFHGKVSKRHHTASPGTARGDADAKFQVLKRGLNELRPSDIETVLDLIEGNALYRGQEHKPALLGFQELQQRYQEAENKEAFAWLNIDDRSARLRNTVIGTLLVDLSNGLDLEDAVRKFENMVAPANYKRPTALITPRMVEDAQAKLAELGLEHAIERRCARLDDVHVNDVLFVDKGAAKKMKGGIAELLGDAVSSKPVNLKGATEITGDEFLSTVLPLAKSLSVLFENKHLGNLVSLTAPVHEDTGRLFKWDNDFAWSYDGDVADSMMRRAVKAKGGRVDGVLRFTHQWNHVGRNASLMDLHVFMPGSSKHEDGCHDRYPSGQRVGWNQRQDYASQGVQDVDYTAVAPANYVPVENITFPTLSLLKDGVYTLKIHNWQLRPPTNSGFKAEVEFGGEVFEYDHPEPLKHKEWITLAEVTLSKGVFSIEHKHPTTTTSRQKWGLTTGQLIPVDTLMLSPNYWQGQGVGNKHLFFILRGAKNPDPVRGIYNEFLRSDLEKHRKVFEVLGSKAKAEPSDDGLCGLGFSSTRKDEVTIVADGRPYAVKF